MAPLRLVAGLCALFLGRRLFWLFVGIVGFAVGAEVATRVFAGRPHTVVLMIAVAGGVAGAILAHWMQELMAAVVGFITGSYIGAQLLLAVMPYPGRMLWFALLVGGTAGALLAASLFDWAIIVLSSLVGASLILTAVSMGPRVAPVVLLGLIVVGIGAQASMKRRRQRPIRT